MDTDESSRRWKKRVLLTRFNLGSDQSNVIDAYRVTNVDDFSHAGEVEVWIALDEHDLLSAGGKDFIETGAQLVLGDVVLINLVAGNSICRADYLHHNGAVVGLLLVGVLGRLGHQRVQPLRGDGHDDHEDDQQHQKYVDQRSYIDVRVQAARSATCHSHMSVPRFSDLRPEVKS